MNIKTIFFKYVSLNILGMIGLSCYILADTFFVARGIGASGLAALNLAIPVYSFINGIGLMIGMGGGTRYGITKSNKVFTGALYFVGIIAILFVLLGIFLSGEISSLLGANSETYEMTSIYIKTILCFAPAFLLNNVIICFVRNDGNPKLSMCAMLIGSFSNILLDYIFVFPLKMGMFGAVLATGLAPIISLIVFVPYFLKKKNNFKYVKEKPSLQIFKSISSLGMAALIAEVSAGIVIIVFNDQILQLEGNLGVAAYSIIANIALVVMAIFTGISQGIQPIISKYYRKGDMASCKQIFRYGSITAIVISLVVYGIVFFFGSELVSIFNQPYDEKLAQLAVFGIRIYFIAFFFLGFNVIVATYFSSIEKPIQSFVIAILRGFVIIIPMNLLLAHYFELTGIWFTLTITELIVLCVSVTLLYQHHKKSIIFYEVKKVC